MEDDLDESVFDYISEFDFEGLLPLFWIKCGKDKETLRQKLINDYQMSHEGLLDEAVSDVIKNYEVALFDKEFLGWNPNEWPMDGSYYSSDSSEGELDEEALVDIWLIQYFKEHMGHIEYLKGQTKDQADRQRSSGLFLKVREADGEHVINKAGCLLVLGGGLLVIIISSFLTY